MSTGVTSNGAKIFIGTTATATDQSEFEADSYIEIGGAIDIGEFGDESTEVTSIPLSEGRVLKFKGSRNAGTLALIVDYRADDVGQQALVAAEATTFDYNFKVEIDDAGPLDTTGTVNYFRAKVMSKRQAVGAADNMVRRTFNLGINSAIVEVDPA